MDEVVRRRELQLAAYVSAGAVAGIAYVIFDVLSESRLRTGTLTGVLAQAHAVIDRAMPILVGALLGMCLHYWRLRAELSAAQAAAERAEALRARLQKVERDQAVWVLAAAVLHELNNPLHAVGLLLDELSGIDDPEESAALLARARAQVDRAFSHLEMLRAMRSAGEPELQRVALDGIVHTLTADLGSIGAEDGVSVRMECVEPVYASGDPAYIRTILENLVDNSLHSVRANGGRTVVLRLATEQDRAVVRVSDDGPPLQSDVRATLFEPLRSTKPHGLGLGLPIARALARAMRGDLSFDDEHGKVFRLELPLRGGT